MPRYSPREEITAKALERLVSLSSVERIAQARASGLDDVVPASLKPSARAYVDPRTGKLYSKTAVQTARTFYEEPKTFRTMREATPKNAARERMLDDLGFTFPAGDWAGRRERDERVARIEEAYRDRLRREGKPVPRGKKALYAEGSEFRAALDRLSPATPPGLKHWTNERQQRRKQRALEELGLRPKGFQAPTGTYTAADLARAWRERGVRHPPRLALKRR